VVDKFNAFNTVSDNKKDKKGVIILDWPEASY
jgi:hypothetical protein